MLLLLSGPLTFFSALILFPSGISISICFTIIYPIFNLHIDHVKIDEPCFKMIIFKQNA